MLKISVDHLDETHHEQLVRNNSLLLCLSILHHLGFRGEYKTRSFYGKFAMLALNVRNIVILFALAANSPARSMRVNPLDDPDVVDALADCAKWALDLLAYACDGIFNLLDDPEFMAFLTGSSFQELAAYLQANNNIALHMVLCSSTRGFLSTACRRLQHLDSISARATQYYEMQQQQATAGGSLPQRPALIMSYLKMQRYTSSSLVKLQAFDKLLLALGEDIRQAYAAMAAIQVRNAASQGQSQGPPEQAAEAMAKRLQAHCEQALLLAKNPPQPFQPLLYRFFNETLRNFRAQTDPSKLFFADYSILELDDDRSSLQARRKRRSHVDVFRRVEITPLGRYGKGRGSAVSLQRPAAADLWRCCVRCTAVMENVVGTQAALTTGYTFMVHQQRRCSCGGNWALLPREEFTK